MLILGAGLAGLLAACSYQTARIVEQSKRHVQQHKALLRFRSTAVAELTGVPFRKVRVHKGICVNGRFVQPDIRLANSYAKKTIGRLVSRSIWSTESVDRYVAPDDFYDELVDRHDKRIEWETRFHRSMVSDGERIISTLPMPVTLSELGLPLPAEFRHANICVARFRVNNCDLHQTVYFPGSETNIYRASITNDLLIVEFTQEGFLDTEPAMKAFGLGWSDVQALDTSESRFGKILPIDESVRQATIGRLTRDYRIFSVGRFATWRNILLDDVVHDLNVVRRIMQMSEYERTLKVTHHG